MATVKLSFVTDFHSPMTDFLSTATDLVYWYSFFCCHPCIVCCHPRGGGGPSPRYFPQSFPLVTELDGETVRILKIRPLTERCPIFHHRFHNERPTKQQRRNLTEWPVSAKTKVKADCNLTFHAQLH